jgi:hypothetical protein
MHMSLESIVSSADVGVALRCDGRGRTTAAE